MRGKIDHGDKGTSLIATTIERFDPTPEEVEAARAEAAKPEPIPEPVLVTLDAARLPASIIDELKHVLGNHAGETEVVLDIRTSAGPRTLRLGAGYRVEPTPSLRAELANILGPTAVQATG